MKKRSILLFMIAYLIESCIFYRSIVIRIEIVHTDMELIILECFVCLCAYDPVRSGMQETALFSRFSLVIQFFIYLVTHLKYLTLK